MRGTQLRRGLIGAVAGTLVLVGAAPALADVSSPDDLPEPTADQIAGSVQVWEVGGIQQWDLDGAVRGLESVESEGEETTISLSTDILFTPNSWELPRNASNRIEELVADIPDEVQVRVSGHTDSTPTGADFDNQELSESRAEAVAEVLREVRGDLELDVAGLADSEPVESEDPEDPSTFAANRRVEIVYQGAA